MTHPDPAARARVLVFGAGAVGSVIAAVLSRAGHDVDVIARGAHADAIAKGGLRVDGPSAFVAHPRSVGIPSPRPYDVIVLSTKAYDLDGALSAIKPAVGPESVVLTVQNGLGNWERAMAALPNARVVAGSLIVAATLEDAGHVRWNGVLKVTLGGRGANRATAQELASWLASAGIDARAVDDLASALWTKAIINATLTTVGAIARKTHGELLDDPALVARMKSICAEAAAIARAEGVTLPEPDPWLAVERLARSTPTHRSSMLQSIERGRPTELDAITGEILAAARRHGIPAPENERVYLELRALDSR